MLNYIWMSLIAIGILVALGNDVADEAGNVYRNGVPLEATFEIHQRITVSRQEWKGDLVLGAGAFNAFYGKTSASEEIRQPGTIMEFADKSSTLSIAVGETAPGLWREMVKGAAVKDRLTARVTSMQVSGDGRTAHVTVVFEPIHFMKMKAVTQAALDIAGTAVNIALGLIGIMAMWLGVMKVAEEAGLLRALTRLLTPLTKRLFPDVPPDHPAIGAIIMNTAANMLGLSNAATPLGLKAMEELNKLNPRIGTATNAMVTFLAINTGGLILIPATAIAVRASSGSSNPGIIIGTSIVGAGVATIAGIAASKVLQRLPRYKREMSPDTKVESEVSNG